MKKFLILLVVIFITIRATAQFVTIPDASFVTYLQNNYPSCMNGNQMDTTCTSILNETVISVQTVSTITDLTGIEYFKNLQTLNIEPNNVTNLGTLPASLKLLDCPGNALSSLPQLPDSLTSLYVFNNNLTSLPALPALLLELRCDYNNLTSLPDLPDSLLILSASNNLLGCLPIIPSSVVQIYLWGNPIVCIPNYIPAMAGTGLDSLMICAWGNVGISPTWCLTGMGISGSIVNDVNSNCLQDSGDGILLNTAVKLYDSTGNNFLGMTSTSQNGEYYFNVLSGTYKVEIDSLNSNYIINCQVPGSDTIVSPSVFDSIVGNVNFYTECNNSQDFGVQSIFPSGFVFPGQTHQISVLAGDLTTWTGLICSSGIGGTVTISITGPLTYVGPSQNALTPAVSGLNFTYSIADFGAGNFNEDFGLLFLTDTTAQAGDSICVNVQVNSSANDINLANNDFDFCYEVVNSYDPNDKQVDQATVEPGYDDWLTYTIRFQNTGSAPAFNIRLEDTLSSLLDFSTFEVIGYKHANYFNLTSDKLKIYFPNIMLPDSSTNFQESIGYFQYRIKPVSGLPLGTEIENKAYIFFDYNEPIITNTAITTYAQSELSINGVDMTEFQLFPNPNSGQFILKSDQINDLKSVEVYNMLGQPVPVTFERNGTFTEISLLNETKGLFVVKIKTESGIASQRIIVR